MFPSIPKMLLFILENKKQNRNKQTPAAVLTCRLVRGTLETTTF